MAYRSRILKEAQEASKLNDKSIFLFMNDTSIASWKAYMIGPDDSPYKDGIFELSINLGNYPMQPPKVFLLTKIFHPNIHFQTGEICLEVFKENWTPSWTLESIIRAILFLLSNPNPDSPLNCDAGNLIRKGDMKGFWSMARMYTNELAVNRKEISDILGN